MATKLGSFMCTDKGRVSMNASILITIIISTWHLSEKVNEIQRLTHNRWSSIHMKVWTAKAETMVEHSFPQVDEILDIVAED